MKKSKNLITLIIVLMSLQIYSQNSNEFGLYYGLYDSEFFMANEVYGAGSHEILKHTGFGFKYLKHITDKLKLETGINYTKLDVEIYPAPTGLPVITRFDKMELISIPFYVNYTFLQYLFINGGPFIDFNLAETSLDKQSGIGYGLGIGGKYEFSHFLISINPSFKKHSVIPFAKNRHHRRLIEIGIQFGISYKI